MYDYRVKELVSSMDTDMGMLMRKMYDAGFHAMNVSVFPNGSNPMSTFTFYDDTDAYTVSVDINGNVGEVTI